MSNTITRIALLAFTVIVIIGGTLIHNHSVRIDFLRNSQTTKANTANTSASTETPTTTCGETCMNDFEQTYEQNQSDQADSIMQDQQDAASYATPDPTSNCTPISNEGTCYEPGEYCRHSDVGLTGISGDGMSIVCTYNNGLRWEPY